MFDGESVLADHAVVVTGASVVEVVPRRDVPHGMPVTYEPAATILPGLIDAHAHHMQWQPPLFLAHGVTTIRDVGNPLEWILAERELMADEACPTMLCVGPLLDGPAPLHPLVARSSADAEAAVAAVRETAEAGVDGIKLYTKLHPEWLPAMVAEAHSHGLKASMHCQQAGALVAAEAGVDEFHHLDGLLVDIWPDRPPGWIEIWGDAEFSSTADAQRRAADRIAQAGMAATPTLAYWHSQWRIRAVDYSDESDAAHVPPEMIAWQGRQAADGPMADQWERALGAAQRFTGLLVDRGVTVLAGSDVPCGAQTPGLSLWREVSLLAQCGMSAIDALRAATSRAATFLARPELGHLRAGSAADLVVVRGDPTDRIPERPDIVSVVHGGRVYRPGDLIDQARALAPSVTDAPWSEQFKAHAPGQ